MSKNKVKFLLKTIPTATIPAALVVSMETNSDNNTPGTPKPAPAPEKPKDNDPHFNTFAEIGKKSKDEIIKGFIKNAVDFVSDRISKLEKDLETSKEYKSDLSKLTHLNRVKAFLENNESNIATNPEKYGLEIHVPDILTTVRDYKKTNITVNGQKYDDIRIGSDSKTDYSKTLSDLNGQSEKDGNFSEKNTANTQKVVENLENYKSGLNEKIREFFGNENEFAELDKDYELVFDKQTQSYKVEWKQSSEKKFKDIEGLDKFESYIASLLKQKTLDYDLNKNKELLQDQDQDQPQNQNQDDKVDPSKPTPNDPKEKDQIDDVTIPSEKVPDLEPVVKSSAYAKPLTQLTNEDVFFNNPFNTRYKYTLVSVSEQNGKAIATVELKDAINESNKRLYQKDIKKEVEKEKAYLYEQYVSKVSQEAIKLYD
uniref:MSC_0620 family F1-like ATPase-associated subunit n=1 Tax=Mycoplasma leonicaptivi TaxID=36742 RepID=UPI00047FD9E8